MSFEPEVFYRKRLNQELAHRIQRNGRYSLRSFAQAIGVDSSALSQILSGRRSVSTKLIKRLFDAIELSPVEQKQFLESVISEQKRKGLARTSPELKKWVQTLKSGHENSPVIEREMGLDEFRVIADWYHYAILEMTFAEDFQSDHRWIAKMLNLPVMEAKLAIDRLLHLELLEWKEDRLCKTDLHLDTKDKSKTSIFLRRRQRQILEKSIHSLENDPIEERNHSSLTLCIDPRRIPEAKKKIQKVLWELGQNLVEGKPLRVYELSINLIPLQKQEKLK